MCYEGIKTLMPLCTIHQMTHVIVRLKGHHVTANRKKLALPRIQLSSGEIIQIPKVIFPLYYFNLVICNFSHLICQLSQN